jgi:PTH1 family peptidyl-tRNA hydrolase
VKLICGLGNPGREYEKHRHNIGFMVVEALLSKTGGAFDQHKFDARVALGAVGGEKVLLLEPQTFMNLSGRSVGAARQFYKIEPVDLLVVHDELDLPYEKLQLKLGGGHGGHNGLRSITENMGPDYARLRFGVGKPEGPNAKERVSGHVLSNFSKEEQKVLDELIVRSVDACLLWIREGMQGAMNKFNRR